MTQQMTTTTTREWPILMTGAMVVASLEDRKTQTRRVVRPSYSAPRVPPQTLEPWLIDGEQETDNQGLPCWMGTHPSYPTGEKWFSCPYGVAGDRLWVRETWTRLWFDKHDGWQTFYRAGDNLDYVLEAARGQWRPSIHMPRWASRLSLNVLAVRVEQLQHISNEDIEAEGIPLNPMRQASYRNDSYQRLEDFKFFWDRLNPRYSWASNPWVWVIEYKRMSPL